MKTAAWTGKPGRSIVLGKEIFWGYTWTESREGFLSESKGKVIPCRGTEDRKGSLSFQPVLFLFSHLLFLFDLFLIFVFVLFRLMSWWTMQDVASEQPGHRRHWRWIGSCWSWMCWAGCHWPSVSFHTWLNAIKDTWLSWAVLQERLVWSLFPAYVVFLGMNLLLWCDSLGCEEEVSVVVGMHGLWVIFNFGLWDIHHLQCCLVLVYSSFTVRFTFCVVSLFLTGLCSTCA